MKMRRLLFCVFLEILVSSLTFADFSWEEVTTEMEFGEKITTKERMYLSKRKFAQESEDSVRVIVDFAENTITFINDEEKSYYTTDIDEMGKEIQKKQNQAMEALESVIKNLPEDQREEYKKIIESQMGAMGEMGESQDWEPASDDYESTGESAQIVGYTARRFIATGDDGTVYEMWCARDLVTDELKELYTEIQKIRFFKDNSENPGIFNLGFPLKTVEKTEEITTTTEVISIDTKSVPKSKFSIPSGYTETEDMFSFGMDDEEME